MKNTFNGIIALLLVLGLGGCGEVTPEKIETWKTQGNVKKLIRATDDPRQFIRIDAIAALAELKNESAVDALAALFNDSDPVIAHKAIDTVIATGGPAAEQHILGILGYETPQARAASAKAMGEWKVAAAVDPLIGLLNDEHKDVAALAAASLGQLGNRKALQPLAGKLGERSFDLRNACVQSISKIGGEEAVQMLAPLLDDFSEKIRQTVVETLIGMGEVSTAASLEALRSEGEFARFSAAAVLKGTGNVPTSGSDLVWYTLAGMPQDPKEKVDFARVKTLAGIEDGIDALVEAAAHANEKVRDYAFHALQFVGEPAADATVAVAEQKATKPAKAWFATRANWKGGPPWRHDLWGAAMALNPIFRVNPAQIETLGHLDKEARSLMDSYKLKPVPEMAPMLIAQTATPETDDAHARENKPLAEKRLAALGKKVTAPLIAGLEDGDISIASSCARVLVKIDSKAATKPLVESFTRKVEAGVEMSGSGFLDVVATLDDPAIEPLLVKVRPNDIRAIQVFEEKYPDIRVSIIPMRYEIDPAIKAQPFRLKYIVGGKTKELKVVFRPNETGEWVPTPPLPDPLP